MSLKELREKRAGIIETMRALVNLAEQEKRQMTAEDDAKFAEMDADQMKLKTAIEQREKIEAAERELAANPPAHISRPPLEDRSREVTSEERKKKEMTAFTNYLRFGFDGLDGEERALMARRRSFISAADFPAELRAQGVGTGGAGGYLVPQGFSDQLEQKLKAFGGVRAVARPFPTPTGNDIPWPVVDDTSNVGELLAENTGAANQDVTFTQVTLKAFKYSSKLVPVSMELLQDSFFDIQDILTGLLAERIGRITNTHFTTGTGSGQPEGVVTSAGSGKVGTTGQTTSIILDDIVDLEHAVDPLYRPGSLFMMADSSLKVIKKIKDTTGRFIWAASLQVGTPDSILGYPYQINQDIVTMAANAKSVLFGNFQRYVVRDVKEVAILRLNERYAELGQVGFIAFSRADGRYINASAVKYYQNSAT